MDYHSERKMDGFETCCIIRRTSNIPILMMSAKNDEGSKLMGYDSGADDYIDKPIAISILVAKIKALMKRSQIASKEEKLFNAVWGIDCFSEVATLNVHIRWLREKLEEDPKNPKLIQTVWRVGYKFGD